MANDRQTGWTRWAFETTRTLSISTDDDLQPEWYFANILNALSDHIPFVRNEVQRLVDEADSHPGRLSNASRAEEIKMDTPATTDFITAMLRPLERKLRASIPQLLQLSVPNVLAHTIYQALQFDAALESMFGYQPINTHSYGSQGAWRGTADVILGDRAWFNSWKDAEKKCKEGSFSRRGSF